MSIAVGTWSDRPDPAASTVTPDRPDTGPTPDPADLSALPDSSGAAETAEPAANVVLPDTVVRRTDPIDLGARVDTADGVATTGPAGRVRTADHAGLPITAGNAGTTEPGDGIGGTGNARTTEHARAASYADSPRTAELGDRVDNAGQAGTPEHASAGNIRTAGSAGSAGHAGYVGNADSPQTAEVGDAGGLGGGEVGDRVDLPDAVVEGIGGRTFEELFRLRYEGMVRVAYLLLGSQPEAEDVVQDAFARIELRWSRLDNPEGYLHRCVVNRSHDMLRRRRLEQRFRSLRRDETTELGADELADALAALPPKRRTAVVLKYYAGLREREIAEAMGVRPGTVKSMLHRALAQLREVIER